MNQEKDVSKTKKKLKVIPLGGLEEIGKNICVFEFGGDIIVVDCGLAFPEDDMLGIDLVIPDITYLVKNKDKVRGIIITHGHEDHIGALPYVLKDLNVPIYGTKLSIGLVKYKLSENEIIENVSLNVVEPGQVLQLGAFRVEFIRSTHSIADSVSLAIFTPVGVVIHTSDFKVDHTPMEGMTMDLGRIAEIGRNGVLLLLADSTNVEKEGFTKSEKMVGEAFNEIFMNSEGRIIVAIFASNVHRIQQVINAAIKFNKKVALCGKSIENVAKVAIELGYLNVIPDLLIDIDTINKYELNELVIITTGTQGEPMSALTRIASSDHKKVQVIEGDLFIISASPIPGNEKLVSRVINELFKKGANVIYEAKTDFHVSGHACKEELKIMHSLVKPKFFMPVHGEYRHLQQHAKLANNLGMPKENIYIMSIGKILELSYDTAKISGTVTSGKVLVDGLGVGDVGNIVLRDRKHLSQDGLIVIVITISSDNSKIVAGPDIISRGFVYVRESEHLMEEMKEVAKRSIDKCSESNKCDWASMKNGIKESLREYIYERTKRKPMILPIIMEI